MLVVMIKTSKTLLRLTLSLEIISLLFIIKLEDLNTVSKTILEMFYSVYRCLPECFRLKAFKDILINKKNITCCSYLKKKYLIVLLLI